MFDLITDTSERPLRRRSLGSTIAAIALHLVILAVVVVLPLLMATNQLPAVVPTMLAFVAAQPVAPPPPPPPPPPRAATVADRRVAQSAPTTGQFVAPIEAPAEVQPERVAQVADAGVLGGVEGGVPGGVVGGIVGGIVEGVAALPPPPPPPPRKPVRIGGQITAPALVRRVEPVYPDIAAVAKLSGTVILEANVGTDGCVESVKVLRSRHTLLDQASVEALKQWQYSPLVLNGIPTPFVLTVTFTFSVQ